jgi:predicted ATPase/DNA-binding SARP family transcriptional activator
MQYRVLGPLDVVDGTGRRRAVGGARQQSVLASLLLRAGQTVTLERLVDELWEEPPATAVKTARVYVSRLRHELPAGAIKSRPGGYVLVLDDDELDLRAFEQAAEEGRRALAAGNSGRAAELLRQALALWRGPALAGLTSEALRLEAERLEEGRLRALEDRLEADLGCGREREIVPELQALVQEEPFRERPRAQLMMALYRSGRPGDALELYRETRRLLVEELGMEPGQELRKLERAILQGDPGLDLPPEKGRSNLPMQPTPLIGRERELREVLNLLRANRLLTLTGPGGVGKTRLALQAAAEVVDDFRDGVWFVSLAAVPDPELVVPAIASTIGVKTDLSGFLRSKRLVLVLDNLEQLLPRVASRVAELLAAPGVKVLATSRERLALAAEQEYPVPTLTLEEAVSLFTARARQLRSSFGPDEHVELIAQRLDGLPLALELAAARVKVLTPRQIVERLGRSLDLLTIGTREAPERQRTLRATIEWSYELLPEDERRLFARLAVFAGGFDLAAAGAVSQAKLDTLHALVEKSLLGGSQEGRFLFLETIRAFALQRLEALPERERVQRAHAQFVAALGEQTQGTPIPSWSRDADNFRAALAWARATQERELVVRLVTVAEEFALRPAEVVTLIEDALAEADVTPLPLVAAAREASGDAHVHMGDGTRARREYEAGLIAASRSDDDQHRIELLTRLGSVSHVDGDLATARERHEQALVLAARAGDARCLRQVLFGLGDLAIDEGDVARAGELIEQSLALAREQGDLYAAAWALHDRGELALATGNLRQAERHYQDALRRAEALDYWDIIVDCVGGLAVVAAERRDPSSAGRLRGIQAALQEETGFSYWGPRRREYDQRIATCAATDEASFSRAVARGRASGRAALATLLGDGDDR